MNQVLLPQKEPTMQQLAKSIRPRTPQTIYNAPIAPEIFVINGVLLQQPLPNVDFLANYRIFSDIAAGSYGQTFLAKDLNGQTLAIKKLTTHIRQHIEEGRFLAQLEAATIPKIHSCFVQGNFLYIVEEAGEINLEELLSFYVQLPESLIWTIAADCLNSIQACHEEELAHLDVKPSNVLIFKNDYFGGQEAEAEIVREAVNQTPDCMSFTNAGLLAASSLHFSNCGQSQAQARLSDPLKKLRLQISQIAEKVTFMLIDFGNAQKAPFKADTSCGDARYLERTFLQTGVPSLKCDLFSLGAMLFECLTGVVLPVGGELFERLRAPGGIFVVTEMGEMLRLRYEHDDRLISLIYELLYGKKTVFQVIQLWEQCFPERNYQQINQYRTENVSVIQASGEVNQRFRLLSKGFKALKKEDISVSMFIRQGAFLPLLRLKSNEIRCSRIKIIRNRTYSPMSEPLNYFAENSNSDDQPSNHFFPVPQGRLISQEIGFYFNEDNFGKLDAEVLEENDGIAELKGGIEVDRSYSEIAGFHKLHGSPRVPETSSANLITSNPQYNDVTSEITYAEPGKMQVKSIYDDESVVLSMGKDNLALSIDTSTNSYIENDSAEEFQAGSSSSLSQLNLQYQPFNKTMEFFLSSLEFFSGIASMIYVYPLKKYHPTPTTVCSSTELMEEKSDSDLNKQNVKASFRPSSGSFRILSESELIRQGYESVNNGYVDCFEKKRQNNWFLHKLHHHRLVMFLFLNLFFVMLRLRKRSTTEKTLQGALILLYAGILERLNKHNLELNYDTKYLSIHYTNIYVDPVKAKSCFMGFIVPVVFTLQNCVQFDYTSSRKVFISLSIFSAQLVIIGVLGVF